MPESPRRQALLRAREILLDIQRLIDHAASTGSDDDLQRSRERAEELVTRLREAAEERRPD